MKSAFAIFSSHEHICIDYDDNDMVEKLSQVHHLKEECNISNAIHEPFSSSNVLYVWEQDNGEQRDGDI